RYEGTYKENYPDICGQDPTIISVTESTFRRFCVRLDGRTHDLEGSANVVDLATPKEEDIRPPPPPSRVNHGGYGAYNAYITAATRYAALGAPTLYDHPAAAPYGRGLPEPMREGMGKKIFVGRLPHEANADDLHQYFGRLGCILDVYVPKVAIDSAASHCLVTAASQCLYHRNVRLRKALTEAKIVNALIIRTRLHEDLLVGNALVTMLKHAALQLAYVIVHLIVIFMKEEANNSGGQNGWVTEWLGLASGGSRGAAAAACGACPGWGLVKVGDGRATLPWQERELSANLKGFLSS
ncbi:RNA-binding (RRM/RBD/RNP motifs) family protein, partial [Thalictrum thalictroides]